MSRSARDVAAVLRERVPGLPTKKLHKLLYYCQGHHLATFGVPLRDYFIGDGSGSEADPDVYWIFEAIRTVRCDNFGTLGLPI